MVGDFVWAFLVSVAGYGLTVAIVFVRLVERRRDKGWRMKLVSLTNAVDVINFANALIASVLSSWALYELEERFIVRGGRTGGWLADCVLGIVCGYIAVEILLVSLTGCSCIMKGNVQAWSQLKHSHGEMVLFHAVAFVGLTSVVLRNSGYPIALWVVWTEITSVFIGLDNFMSCSRNSIYRRLAKLAESCANLLFVGQRVLLFYYLLWLSWRSFVWETGFVFQLGILLAGAILNTHMAWNIYPSVAALMQL